MTDSEQPELRWVQRFRNFQRAFLLLGEVAAAEIDALTKLEQEGAIQRFEFTFELGWKVQRDLLEHNGIDISSATPRQIIKEAFAAKYIVDGQAWVDMLEMRNLLSHTYDDKVFNRALKRIKKDFWTQISQFHQYCEDVLNAK